MYDSQIMASRVKALAEIKNISIKDLMDKCGLGVNALQQASKTENGMKAKNLFTIAEILECSVDYLLGRTDSPAESKNVVQNNVTGDNNNDVSISVNDTSYSEQQEQIGKVMAGLTPRQRVDLMKTIYQFADEHGIIIE